MKIVLQSIANTDNYYHFKMKLNCCLSINHRFNGDTKLSEIVSYFNTKKLEHEKCNSLKN